MKWVFEGDRPIYLQLQEQLRLRIVSGFYPPGGRLPAVRELAAEAAVNPNTLQRALTELEREGLVYVQRTSGRFVTEDAALIAHAKEGLALEQIEEFFCRMADMGYEKQEAVALAQASIKEGE